MNNLAVPNILNVSGAVQKVEFVNGCIFLSMDVCLGDSLLPVGVMHMITQNNEVIECKVRRIERNYMIYLE